MGTSHTLHNISRQRRDHPHAYGDKVYLRDNEAFLTGSSPRVWGQECPPARVATAIRIIPTRMGTRCHFYPNHGQGKDHPHAYGDKRCRHPQRPPSQGSSPRVWGQVGCSRREVANYGIIPTRMGTREAMSVRQSHCWDHPHAYGDKAFT